MHFSDEFRHRQQLRHRAEWSAFKVHVQPCQDHTLSIISEGISDFYDRLIKKLCFIDPYYITIT
jgi:hypothetical protein